MGLNAGYTDAKITQAAPNSPQLVGSAVYQVPNWTGSANFGYWTQLFANVRGFVRGDYNYAGFSYSANNDVTNPRLRPAYRIINARFGVQMKGYEVALFGNNLGNERANLADSESIAAEVPGRPRIVVNQPRTVGIEARAQF